MRLTRHVNVPDSTPGERLFVAYCAACHQYDGQDVGQAPPLAGTAWVTGPEERLIKIVLHGIRGQFEIAGQVYNREMPGFGEVFSDQDVASLLTFVRHRFGRLEEPVETSTVEKVRSEHRGRTEYWQAEKLISE